MNSKRAQSLQTFTKEYIDWSRGLTPTQRAQFVEDFMRLAQSKPAGKSKLISLKVPQDLLHLFRLACDAEGVAYQTQIKNLMRQWLLNRP